jgi:hypothetical protein
MSSLFPASEGRWSEQVFPQRGGFKRVQGPTGDGPKVELLDAGAAGSVLWSKGAGGLSLPGLLNGTPRVDTRHHKGGP